MADNYCANIEIGGKISKPIAEALIEVINHQCVSTEYGESAVKLNSIDELLECVQDGLLCFCDDQARWGEFEELEKFLVTSNIPFTRKSEASLDTSAEMIEFRPNMEKPIGLFCLGEKPAISSESFLKVLNDILVARSLTAIDEIISEAKEFYSLEGFPPLPPFEIE